MNSKIDYQVNPKENIYFIIRLIASLGLYYFIFWLFFESLKSENPAMKSVYILYFYLGLIVFYLFMRFGLMIGYLKGNAVRLNKNQLPEIYQIVVKQSEQLELKYVPRVFIMQSGGILNAFAARFLGRNYIVLYSEIVEATLEKDKSILEFIIGHELGHIKRNHMIKNLLLFPSYLVPFLGAAYSRACENTCDSIGYSVCPTGVKGGILMLASGKSIYKKVNINEFMSQDYSEDGFWKWFAEKVSTHPNLTKRIACFANKKDFHLSDVQIKVVEHKEEDSARFMPKY